MSTVVTTISSVQVAAFCSATGPVNQQGQSFQANLSGTINTITVNLAYNNNGAPTFDPLISIQADSSGSPSGTDLGSGHVDHTTMTSNPPCRDFSVTISPGVPVTNGTTYWVRYYTDDNNFNGTAFFETGGQNPSVLSAPVAKQFNGTSWVTQAWTNRAVVTIDAGGTSHNLPLIGAGS